MQTASTRPTSLTAHLARAAESDDTGDEVVAQPQPAEEVVAPVVANDGRCTASVMPGHRCARPAVKGGSHCVGHGVMLDDEPAPVR